MQKNTLYTDKIIEVERDNAKMEFPYAGRFLKVNNNQDVQAVFQNTGGTAGIELYNGNHDGLKLTLNMDNEFVIKNKEDTEHLVINEQGQVGIGTGKLIDYNGRLTVNGYIVCESVEVFEDVSADYVFAEDYNLRPLSHVENYIKQHKHLEGIPSADEFKENGYKIHDMDEMLLKKIEELTLYTIEQEKKIEQQAEEVNALREKNEALKQQIQAIEILQEKVNSMVKQIKNR